MFRLLILTAAVACVLGAPRTIQPRPRYQLGDRIVGGTEVAIEEVPYQLSFEEFGSHICGASIISADWAVTAAHCADGVNPDNVGLRSGSARRGQDGVLQDAAQIIVNDDYDSFLFDFDIAVIRVSTPFAMSETTAVIPLAATAPATDTPAVVSGWGTISSGGGNLPTNLRWVEVPIYDQETCNSAYDDFGGVTDRMICAGLIEGGKDSCQGDSGGPLVVNGELVGIVSWGLGCAVAGFPGVYSNVAQMRDWVNENAGL